MRKENTRSADPPAGRGVKEGSAPRATALSSPTLWGKSLPACVAEDGPAGANATGDQIALPADGVQVPPRPGIAPFQCDGCHHDVLRLTHDDAGSPS